MFVIRHAKADDVPTLLKLAKMVHFINLPADNQMLHEKVQWSRQSFLMAAEVETDDSEDGKGASKGVLPGERTGTRGSSVSAGRGGGGVISAGLRALTGQSPLFMFVMEDMDSRGVVGTSQIVSRMGGPGAPNLSFQLLKRELFSTSLQTGVTHTVARLHLDERGPTEIGGLILQGSLRGHRKKLGRFLSLVRFHFIGLHREMFSARVIAEMMGPLTPDGHSAFWEALGRRFINLSFTEADEFCQHSREFMLSLLPKEDIYLTLLTPEARNAVGQVGHETAPARRMLEDLGFSCPDRVDPFDGGPHLEAATDEIEIVKHTRHAHYSGVCAEGSLTHSGMVSTMTAEGEFLAVQCGFAQDKKGRVKIEGAAAAALGLGRDALIGVTPMGAYSGGTTAEHAGGPGAGAGKRTSSGGVRRTRTEK